MFIVDAHLDLSYNVTRGRDVLLPADRQKIDPEEIPTVGLPDLRGGGVGLVCATIFCEPASAGRPGYGTADEAAAAANVQLRWYQEQTRAGQFRFIRSSRELIAEFSSSPGTPGEDRGGGPWLGEEERPQNAILLLEGADAFRTPADVPRWFDDGLRIVGLAWKQTRYAGGTGACAGPLTPQGIELVAALDRAGIIHDLSHLAEASFWQLLELAQGPVMASHSNCRSIVPTDRQLSDAMIRAVVERQGVIGINFFDRFLLPPEEQGKRPATLRDVVRHVEHICQLVGNSNSVGLGTDMDGGLGRDQIPREIRTAGDLPRLANALSEARFSDDDVRRIMGTNWLDFFRRALPK